MSLAIDGVFLFEGKSSLNLGIVNQLRARGRKVFYGWRIVAVGALINAFGAGTFFYGFSTFFNPMIAEFGWSRTIMSGAFSLSRLEGGLEGPIAGLSMSLAMIGTVTAPIFAGYLYDVTQTYTLAFYTLMAMIILAGILFLLIPHTPFPQRHHLKLVS